MNPSTILVCCHANRCRSPIGEHLFKQALAHAGKSQFDVSSAGFLESGHPADPAVIEVLNEVGLDAAAHSSTQLDKQVVRDADLVVVMERAQVRQLAVDYRAFAKVFTVKEFARRSSASPQMPGEDFKDWVARVHEGRTTADLAGACDADDTADPLGMPTSAFRATREELAGAIQTIVANMA